MAKGCHPISIPNYYFDIITIMDSQFMDVALRAVKKAEAIIYKYLDEEIIAELKPDQSPVTIADKQAEEVIKSEILQTFPTHKFYGEEGEKADLYNNNGYVWIIDPIDGTKSYIRRNPLFATQLALMHDGEFILGISNAPLLGELIHAQAGGGCYMNGKLINVSTVSNIGEAYMSYGSLKYFENIAKTEPLLKLAKDVRWARGIGDFWSYHLLAQGKIDIMIEAQTKLWDIAAMVVIVREAGGSLVQLDGQPINYSSTSVVATNSILQNSIVNRFAN